MEKVKIVRICDAIEVISNQTDAYVNEIITALQGICFDEEGAGQLREFYMDEEGI
jgi:hypothetical protein